MGQEDFGLPTSEEKIESEEASNDIEDIDRLATTPPQNIKPYFGIAEGERKEVLTLIITSQATLIGSAIGFYFGKNQ